MVIEDMKNSTPHPLLLKLIIFTCVITRNGRSLNGPIAGGAQSCVMINKRLAQVPATSRLRGCASLILTRNRLQILTSRSFSGGLAQLQKLALNKNKLRVIRSGAFNGTRLAELYLPHNLLSCTPDLSGITQHLVLLRLDSNRLYKCTKDHEYGDVTFPHLEYLYLSSNRLIYIPKLLKAAPILRELDLYDNNFHQIPSLLFLQRLESLYVAENEVRCDGSAVKLKHLDSKIKTLVINPVCPNVCPNANRQWKTLKIRDLRAPQNCTVLPNTKPVRRTRATSTLKPTTRNIRNGGGERENKGVRKTERKEDDTTARSKSKDDAPNQDKAIILKAERGKAIILIIFTAIGLSSLVLLTLVGRVRSCRL